MTELYNGWAANGHCKFGGSCSLLFRLPPIFVKIKKHSCAVFSAPGRFRCATLISYLHFVLFVGQTRIKARARTTSACIRPPSMPRASSILLTLLATTRRFFTRCWILHEISATRRPNRITRRMFADRVRDKRLLRVAGARRPAQLVDLDDLRNISLTPIPL